MSNWKPFHFEADTIWGAVDSPAKFVEVLEKFMGSLRVLLTAKRSSVRPKNAMPNFGFGSEHVGPETLGEWLQENNIDISFAKRK